jgi:hypothetical protein
MNRLHLTEDAAAKRIQIARLGRQIPQLFPAIADGRLSMGTARLLAPRLTSENAHRLIDGAAGKSVADVERVLASMFPQAESLRLDDGIVPQVAVPQRPESISHATWHPKPEPRTSPPAVRTKIAPLSPERYTLQVTLPAATHDLLRRAQDLLGHAVQSGNVAEVLERALKDLVVKLEKRKFGASSKSRVGRASKDPRHIPMHVRNAVWERDQGQCTFMSEAGKRCPARRMLEFDHILEVARGGASNVENIRLRCRAHNQYTAEQTFGAGFMQRKREGSRPMAAVERGGAALESDDADVTPWLRALGYPADRVRHAVAKCGVMPGDTPLEDRVKAALRFLMPPHRRLTPAMPTAAG